MSDESPMANFTVNNAAELKVALSAAKGGDTISLASGDYGDVTLNNLKFASDVVIKSADPDAAASFHSISVVGSSGISFVGVNIDMTPTATTYAFSSALRISSSSEISFRDGKIEGGPAVNGVSQDAPVGTSDSTGNILGLYTGRGATIEKSTGITIENTEMSQLMKGVVLSKVDGLQLLNNEIHHTRTGMISGGDVSNAVIDGNNLYSSNPHNFSGAGDHADFIHIWTAASGQDGASENIVITNNLIEQADGQAILGIYLDDNTNGLGFKNVDISDNVILNGNFQGLRLENVFDSTVTDNTLLQTSGAAKTAPGILLRSGSHDNEISGNITSTVDATGNGDVSNKIGDNVIVQTGSASASGYYTLDLAKLFADYDGVAGIYATVLSKLGLVALPERPQVEEPDTTPPVIVAPPVVEEPAPAPSAPEPAPTPGRTGMFLTGADADDRLTGSYGDDTLQGGAGDDVLTGAGGADLMIGGLGDDLYYVDNVNDVIIEAPGGGLDTVGSSIDYTLGSNLENLRLSKTAAIGVGNELANRITAADSNASLKGMAGDDTLIGRTGNDTLSGGTGSDKLYGNAGDDSLSGGAGNDVLLGGLGSDTLAGGAGADRFSYTAKDINTGDVDLIVDFSRAEGDKISLSAIDANINTANKNDAFTFIGKNDFHGRAGELRYHIEGKQTLVEVDIDGDRYADLQIHIDSPIALNVGDFIL